MAIDHISDTARWVALCRTMESERPDALFHDPYARKLAGAKGEALIGQLGRARQMAWSMIVRTAVFDELIQERVAAGADLVVNLAAGFDARPWRLPLPETLRWVDVDFPAVLHEKTEQMREVAPHCRYEAMPVDLTDATARRALLARLGAQSERALVVAEGLLIYLTAEQVDGLGRDLHQAGFRWWLVDLASPRLLAIMERYWGDALRDHAPFQFAPAEGTDFFRPAGWREVVFRSTMEEARRLKRELRWMPFYRFLGRFRSRAFREEMRRMSGFVLLERA